MVDPHLLRKYIMKLCGSTASFLTARSTFARSLAAFNICSYILGIGDRHLDNFLVDVTTGEIIGIDFGHAFGSATELLPYPELVPFRMTPQLVALMDPLGVTGFLSVTMQQVLQALQASSHLILNAMDIFIKEPLMDWTKYAMRLAREQRGHSDLLSPRDSKSPAAGPSTATTSSEDVTTHEWYPKVKLELARRKLVGYNPACNFSSFRGDV